MPRIKVPDFLIPASREILRNLKKVPEKHLLFMIDDVPNISLYVYGTPTRISEVKKDSFFINPKGDKRLGWYVRQASDKSENLWDFFSEELVRLKLKDKKGLVYDVKCNSADAIVGMGKDYEEVYLLDASKNKYLKDAFSFGARKMLSHKYLNGAFNKEEIQKLSNFFYKDFKTEKYTKQSKQIGLEADSVFFPSS
ncbi:MAG: hypothetical protein KJ646_00800 [Nanoarchaeota archaeon]|nr:hypothetical protein [Nanoarchaeota archaeon]